MAFRVIGVLISRILGLPSWESQNKMTFGCKHRGQVQKVLYGERLWLPLSLGCGEFCEFVFACGSFVHQKCSNYAQTSLLFGLCRSMWIIDLLVTCPSPHLEALAHPSTPEVLRAKECTLTPYPSVVFTFGLAIESIKEFGVHELITKFLGLCNVLFNEIFLDVFWIKTDPWI